MRRAWIIICFVVFCLLFFHAPTRAQAADDGFTIQAYDVKIKVSRDNTYHIVENIKTNFTQYKHGIYRDIPITNHIRRSDGSRGTIKAKVKNVSCSERYSTSIVGDNVRFKIGNSRHTVIGEVNYRISYDYIMGNDILEGNDEFYFNIIGTQWTTTISNVTFTIEMPDKFDQENIGMSRGYYGTENPNDFKYGVEGNTIQGKLKSHVILNPGEAVTVRILLPDGYFLKSSGLPWHVWASVLLGIVSMILAFVLWRIFGRDDLVVETIEFYPPEEGNSLDIAFLYNGKVLNKDVVSLIVYLAQKGYLDIIEGDGKSNFALSRKKMYDGDDECERIFMAKLFESGDLVSSRELKKDFHKTIKLIRGYKNSKANREKIYYANSLNKGWILWILCLAIYALTVFPTIYEYTYSMSQAYTCAGSGILLVIMFFLVARPNGEKIWVKLVTTLLVVGVRGGYFFAGVFPVIRAAGSRYLGEYIFAVVSIAVTMIFNALMYKRTEYGTMMLGRIRGFRNFLEMAEKDRLEVLVEENPQYVYDILPYAYVLGVSDKWMKKFETITVEPPTWYRGPHYHSFNMRSFHSFMNHTMSSANASMSSSPRSGGGGISGGGSGGGGGGSW